MGCERRIVSQALLVVAEALGSAQTRMHRVSADAAIPHETHNAVRRDARASPLELAERPWDREASASHTERSGSSARPSFV
jgi:hypothetical protein